MIIGSHIFGIPVEENLPYIIPALPGILAWLKFWKLKKHRCQCDNECKCGKEVK